MEYAKGTKGETFLRQIANSVIMAGIFILLTGSYYCVIKAGIPDQDPPPELQIQYAVNMGIGDELIKDGLLISAGGGMARLIIKLVSRN